MSEIKFASPDEIIIPKGYGLIQEEIGEKDHILGASSDLAGPDFAVLAPNGQWSDVMPETEIQRNQYGDTFMCVSFSLNNTHEFVIKKQFGEDINKSDIFLGKGSGTIRGQGNGKRTVAEWNRTNGFVFEGDYPYLSTTTLDDVYKPLTSELLAKGKKNLDAWVFNYKWLPDNSISSLKEGLKYSPIQVDISASYKTNADGFIVWDTSHETYNHEVLIFGYEEGICWYVFDSECNQYLKFSWTYPFGSPMIHSVKKKNMVTIYKEKGKPALAVKHAGEDSLIAFSGGSVSGENLFKSLYGVKDFKQLPITEVQKFPYPVKHLINTNLYQ